MTAPIDGPDGQVVQLVEQFRAGVEGEVVFRGTDLRRAAGQDEVLSADGRDNVLGRKVPRLQCLQVQIYGNKPLLATIRVRDGGALDT